MTHTISEEDSVRLVELARERNYLTDAQIETVYARQKKLRAGGIDLTFAQTILERRMLRSDQIKALKLEVRERFSQDSFRRGNEKKDGNVLLKFGQYDLIETHADRGHARVFTARDTVMDRLVTLKIQPVTQGDESKWVDRFKREMILAAKLSHPNIITAYSAGVQQGHLVIVMEHVDGMPLEELLDREGNVPEKVAWLMGREVAKGLMYAATHGILHRNIAPNSIVCGEAGQVKIADIGLSKSVTDENDLTVAGTTVGSQFYISPEQARGTGDLDSRTDIYSLGCTIFHALTGSMPFVGESVVEVMRKHVTAPRPDPREMLPEISEGSAKLVMRLMATNPDDRPASAEAAVAEIEALIPTLADPVAVVRVPPRVTPSESSEPAFTLAPTPPGTKSIPSVVPPMSGSDPRRRAPSAFANVQPPPERRKTNVPNIPPPPQARKSGVPNVAPPERRPSGTTEVPQRPPTRMSALSPRNNTPSPSIPLPERKRSFLDKLLDLFR